MSFLQGSMDVITKWNMSKAKLTIQNAILQQKFN